VTPDSFFEGSRVCGPAAAVAMARQAASEGADILDIGGESTRPGARRVPEGEQIARVVPAIRAIREEGGTLAEIPISVDTTRPTVAEAALEAGADAINDVSGATEGGAGGEEGMLALAARHGAGLVLMHRLAPPEQDRYSDRYERPPAYADVVEEVGRALEARAEAALGAGVARGSVVLDPGLGFGKSVEQNLDLVAGTGRLLGAGFPVLSAASRKSFVGRVSRPEAERTAPSSRLAGSLAFSVAHLWAGAMLFRVHDVAAQRAALRAAWAILSRRP
jgi:dihydropteroate synthase